MNEKSISREDCRLAIAGRIHGVAILEAVPFYHSLEVAETIIINLHRYGMTYLSIYNAFKEEDDEQAKEKV